MVAVVVAVVALTAAVAVAEVKPVTEELLLHEREVKNPKKSYGSWD